MVGGPANTNATAMTYTGHMSLSRGWLWLGIFGCSSPERAECRPGTEPGSSGHCVPSSDAVSATPQQRDTGGGEESADFQVELPPPSWTQADVEGTIDRLFRDDHPRVAPVLELWRSMFIGRDHSCPGEGYNIQVPMSGCITSEGWRYTGPATYDVISSPFEEAIILNADTHIIDDEGTVMIFAGTAASSWVDGVGVGHWRVDLRGMIDYPTSETVWIEGGTSMMIFGGGDVGGQAELTGGWSTGGTVISFSLQRDEVCEGLSGTIWLQDPAGPRHALSLACTDCASWSWEDGSPLGEACIDTDEISRWMDNLGAL